MSVVFVFFIRTLLDASRKTNDSKKFIRQRIQKIIEHFHFEIVQIFRKSENGRCRFALEGGGGGGNGGGGNGGGDGDGTGSRDGSDAAGTRADGGRDRD